MRNLEFGLKEQVTATSFFKKSLRAARKLFLAVIVAGAANTMVDFYEGDKYPNIYKWL